MRRVSTVTAVFLKEVDDEFLVKISTHWKTMDKLTYEEMSAVYSGLRERRMFFKVQHTLDDVRLAAATAQLALEMEQREKALRDIEKRAKKAAGLVETPVQRMARKDEEYLVRELRRLKTEQGVGEELLPAPPALSSPPQESES